MPEIEDLAQSVRKAFKADDAVAIRRLLESHPEVKAKINEPASDFESPLIIQVRSRAMLDVLLEAGADVNARSRWWAGGFGLLDCADRELSLRY